MSDCFQLWRHKNWFHGAKSVTILLTALRHDSAAKLFDVNEFAANAVQNQAEHRLHASSCCQACVEACAKVFETCAQSQTPASRADCAEACKKQSSSTTASACCSVLPTGSPLAFLSNVPLRDSLPVTHAFCMQYFAPPWQSRASSLHRTASRTQTRAF